MAEDEEVIRFKLLKTSSKLTSVPFYRALVIHDNTVKGNSYTAQELWREHLCTVNPETIAYVLDCFSANLPKLMAKDGCPRALGKLARFYLGISGTFESAYSDADAQKNELFIGCTTLQDMRYSLSSVKLANVTSVDYNPSIHALFDSTSGREGTLTLGGALVIQGRDLMILTSNSDEGCFLSGGTLAAPIKLVVSVSQNLQLVVAVPEDKTASDIPPGEGYEITVKTRAGRDSTHDLLSASHKVTVATV